MDKKAIIHTFKRIGAWVNIYAAAAAVLTLIFGTSWAVFVLPAALMGIHLFTDLDVAEWIIASLQAAVLIITTQFDKLIGRRK